MWRPMKPAPMRRMGFGWVMVLERERGCFVVLVKGGWMALVCCEGVCFVDLGCSSSKDIYITSILAGTAELGTKTYAGVRLQYVFETCIHARDASSGVKSVGLC